MRRPTTMLASASAAALAALAVTVAAPAIGDDGPPRPDDFVACLRDHGLPDAPQEPAVKAWLNERLERSDATTERAIDACAPKGKGDSPRVFEREVRACLVEHGAQIEGDDPAAIKRWIGEHEDDPSVRDALKVCHIGPPGDKPGIVCGEKGDPPPGTPAVTPASPSSDT